MKFVFIEKCKPVHSILKSEKKKSATRRNWLFASWASVQTSICSMTQHCQTRSWFPTSASITTHSLKVGGIKGKTNPYGRVRPGFAVVGCHSQLARHSPPDIPPQKGKIQKEEKISLEQYKKHALLHLFFLIQSPRYTLSNWNQNTQTIHKKNPTTRTTTIPWNHLRLELLK